MGRSRGSPPTPRSLKSSRSGTRLALPLDGSWRRSPRRPLRRGGKAEPKPRQIWRGLRADAPAAELYEGLDDRKADSSTTGRTVARLLDTVEALEHVRQVVGGDARPRIRDRDENVRVAASCVHADATTLRRVAHRV